MGWDVHIDGGDVLPNPKEPIHGISSTPGSLICAVSLISNGNRLVDLPEEWRAETLKKMVLELDKGNEGLYTDEWCEYTDKVWSGGEETLKEWREWEKIIREKPFHRFRDYTSFCGWAIRDRIRNDAMRFFLYYKAGYKVTFTW